MRTAYLNEQGYRVLRFWNEQVNTEMEDVLQAIYVAFTEMEDVLQAIYAALMDL